MAIDEHVVLVIDDDPDIGSGLRELLEDEGYRVVLQTNGREALEYLKAHEKPCVIFLDLMMPIMDGWEFRREQLSQPDLADIPVVVITAASDRTRSLSAVDVLRKPLAVDRVLDVAAEFC